MEGLYRKELKALEDQYFRWRCNYESMYPHGLKTKDGEQISLDEILQKCVYKGMESEVAKLNERFAKVKGRTHHWIGINPPISYKNPNMKTMHLTLEKLVRQSKIFQDGHYMYSCECHTDNGIRPHIHLFLESTVRPSRIIDMLAKPFGVEAHSIEIKTYRKNTLWNEHIDYIMGNKKAEKMQNVEQDNDEKKILEIPQFIGLVEKI